MAIANYKIRDKTNSSTLITALSIIGLSIGGILILYYEFTHELEQMLAIIILYIILAFGAWIYSKKLVSRFRNNTIFPERITTLYLDTNSFLNTLLKRPLETLLQQIGPHQHSLIPVHNLNERAYSHS